MHTLAIIHYAYGHQVFRCVIVSIYAVGVVVGRAINSHWWLHVVTAVVAVVRRRM